MHVCCGARAKIKMKVREASNPLARTEVEVMNLDEEQLLARLSELIDALGCDFDRLSRSGKEAYDEICSIVNKLQGG